MSENTSNARNCPHGIEKPAGSCLNNSLSPKPLILAVETSGRTGSVALAAGEELLAEVNFSAPMKHSAEIFAAISDLLNRFSRKPSQIEHIYISVGPGSFTGLRIATTMAKILHLANAVKIVAIDTLDVIAANATDYLNNTGKKEGLEKIAAILDAKRGQFFIAAYQNEKGNWVKILPDCLMTAAQFLEQFSRKDEPIWLLGEGLVYYKDKFKTDGVKFLDQTCWTPKASKVHLLGYQMALKGRFADVLTLEPTYLRRPDAKIKQY